MKNYNKILITITALFFSSASLIAQEITNNDTFHSTTKKVTPMYKNGDMLPVRLKVQETRDYEMQFKSSDVGKVDKDVVMKPTRVTQEIYVDNDQDQYYDKFIVINYKKQLEDTFEVVPTKNSIAIKVAPDMLIPITEEGTITSDNADVQEISVEEFTEL